ncbi:hypothetical protein [Chitinimonas taiwanensis]|uniref:hypothetical protein n=1 Tax=Chitinimonas taiwanensis TaxID=240412 RepID=UPI0016088606
MNAAISFYPPLQALLGLPLSTAQQRLPHPLPLGLPEAFRARLVELADCESLPDSAFERLYFDLILCPQLHASIRRMQPGGVGSSDQPASEAIFLDPRFSWSRHLDDRLAHRWRECLLRQGDGAYLDEALGLLAGFRHLAEQLDHQANAHDWH